MSFVSCRVVSCRSADEKKIQEEILGEGEIFFLNRIRNQFHAILIGLVVLLKSFYRFPKSNHVFTATENAM